MSGTAKGNDKDTIDSAGIRHRFAVPIADTICNEWCEMQSNLGFSLRVLIKAYVATNGMSDAACAMNVVVPKKGRKPKTAEDLIKRSFQGGNDTDIQFAQDAYDAKDMYEKDANAGQNTPQVAVSQPQPEAVRPQAPPVTNTSNDTPIDMLSMMGQGAETKISASDDDDETDDLMNM